MKLLAVVSKAAALGEGQPGLQLGDGGGRARQRLELGNGVGDGLGDGGDGRDQIYSFHITRSLFKFIEKRAVFLRKIPAFDHHYGGMARAALRRLAVRGEQLTGGVVVRGGHRQRGRLLEALLQTFGFIILIAV